MKDSKQKIHPRSKHKQNYDFKKLVLSCPKLKAFVKPNPYGVDSIDFANPEAVKLLNTSLLKHFYDIKEWEIPNGYLIPPIPGRADYVHHIADLLSKSYNKEIPKGKNIKVLDIGTGASCIYPIIGNHEYGWSYVASEIDNTAFDAATRIINKNNLAGKIDLRFQKEEDSIFKGVINKGEFFDISTCNPPFHSSLAEAQKASKRKVRNLTNKRVKEVVSNFGGQSNELWCEGGERRFIEDIIRQSKYHANSVLWFTTLVSKQSTLRSVNLALKKARVYKSRTIEMGQGNKSSRIVAWTFLNPEKQRQFVELKSGKYFK